MTKNRDIEVKGLYKIINLKILRRTPGVYFDTLQKSLVPEINAIDRVIHEHGAISPGPVDGVKRPWYMHPFQDDNLIVLSGIRYIDIYTKAHGKIESFTVSPTKIERGGETVCDGAAMLVWPKEVFHRIHSDKEVGSASLNFAKHYEGFDPSLNFNIYDLNTETGIYKVIRQGFKDQPSD